MWADGYISKDGTWEVAHNSTDGMQDYTAESAYSGILYYDIDYIFILRMFLPFNTSSLPDDAIITSVTLQLYCINKSSTTSKKKRKNQTNSLTNHPSCCK